MAKYRIKVETRNSGTTLYYPMYKEGFSWELFLKSSTYPGLPYIPEVFDSEKEARGFIREKIAGEIKSIHYINI